jgi:hypothetical protein
MTEPAQNSKTAPSKEQKAPVPTNRDPVSGDYIGPQYRYHD